MRVFIGVDGGGTKTRTVIVSSSGDLVADLSYRGSNINHYPWGPFKDLLDGLSAAIRKRLPVEAEPAAVFLGMAGIDRHRRKEEVKALIQAQWPGVPVALVHDALPALVSGAGKKEGIVLIGGTGAFAFGINEYGAQHQVGGWGFLLGDEGSGYDIGRRALQAVMKHFDGRGPDTLLVKKVLENYGIGHQNEFIPIVYSPDFTRDQIAAVARLVFEASSQGDALSLHLLDQAAGELCELVDVMLRRLPFTASVVTVVVTGGLFHEGSPLTRMLQQRLRGRAEVVRNEHPPALGAAVLARGLSGEPADPGWDRKVLNLI
jgi:N-acetylglucosamine kinase-like BadF-type ATPase